MSKKVHSTGYPRKFIDKIALIKQKEALTNAYFESAIQGLSDISMKRAPNNQSIYNNDVINNVYPVENNLNKCKDDFSNTSFSPQSFTSDSTINNLQNNSYYQQRNMHHEDSKNDFIESFYETPESNSFNNLQSYGSIKFRPGRDNPSSQLQYSRLSNNEGYPCFSDVLTRDLHEQICSESLPDVSSFNNRNYIQSSFSEIDSSKQYKESNADSIYLKDGLANLKKVKKGANSKKALFEHLRNRGIQNIHPHHAVSSNETANQNLASILGSPSMNRGRLGYMHNQDISSNPASNRETGHLKHYLASNSPYITPTMRDPQCNKDFDSSFRKRHASNNVISLQSQMELNLNCPNEINNYELKHKSLTPTENLQSNRFSTMDEGHLLPPAISGMISADHCRRAASDSSIQNSLKQCNNNISPADFLYNNEGNSFGKTRNYANDLPVHMYHRIKSMTSDPTNNNFQSSLNETPKDFNLQRDNSTSSSFLNSYISRNSPDENLDPNLDFISIPDKHSTPFKFGDLNKLAEESNVSISNNHRCTCIGDDPSQISDPDNLFDMMNSTNNDLTFESTLAGENGIHSTRNVHTPEQSDQCYWTQPADSNTNNYSKEPSPIIKPCENLDPQNVTLDLNTDFSCIPDIILIDADAQRRNSLNMADEVLNNLNMDTSNSDFIPYREKLTFYQPMDMLSEETAAKNCENEY